MKHTILICSLFLVILSIAGSPRQGQINTRINQGATEVRLALPEFQTRSTDPNVIKLTALFNQVLWDDLDYSGNITLVNRSFYPLGKVQAPTDVRVDDWTKQGVNAQYLVFGVSYIEGGDLKFESRLWDLGVVQNRELIAQKLRSGAISEDAVRLTAHTFADQIVNTLFGGKMGIAQTKIAYISWTGNNNKEIYVMEYDGANPYPLTTYRSTSITPTWSPDGEKIAFASTRRGTWNIEILSILDRRSFPFASPPGTVLTPAWSPDGGQIAYASKFEGNMEITVADWNGKNPKRLTANPKIDISPSWNPKTMGQKIAFVSDRSGSQQIYMMDADGTNVERIITEGGDAENPSWSPDGQNIAFAWRKKGDNRYDIYIHDLATGRNSQLTFQEGENERPSWAPDGRHLVFASTRTGRWQIFTMLANGKRIRQLTRNNTNEGPAWSSFIGK